MAALSKVVPKLFSYTCLPDHISVFPQNCFTFSWFWHFLFLHFSSLPSWIHPLPTIRTSDLAILIDTYLFVKDVISVSAQDYLILCCLFQLISIFIYFSHLSLVFLFLLIFFQWLGFMTFAFSFSCAENLLIFIIVYHWCFLPLLRVMISLKFVINCFFFCPGNRLPLLWG